MVAHEHLAHAFIDGVALALELAAAMIIAVAALRAFWQFARAFPRHNDDQRFAHDLRHRFGRSLLLALDFAIGSDVLAVATAPSLDRVIVAGLVVLARVILTLTLEHELRSDARRQSTT